MCGSAIRYRGGSVPVSKDFGDLVETQRASLPHLKEANAAQERMLALLRELKEQGSGLSSRQRAARLRELAEVPGAAARSAPAVSTWRSMT